MSETAQPTLIVRTDAGFEIDIPGWGAVGERWIPSSRGWVCTIDSVGEHVAGDSHGDAPPTNYGAVERAAAVTFDRLRHLQIHVDLRQRKAIRPGHYPGHGAAMYVAHVAHHHITAANIGDLAPDSVLRERIC